MFDDKDTDRLIAAMRAHGVGLLKIKRNGQSLRLVIAEQAAPTVPVAAPVALRIPVHSPDIGRFLPRGTDDGLAPLRSGDAVQPHEVIGYVCNGPVRAIVTPPKAGRMITDLPEGDRFFGFGDTIIELDAT